MKTISLSVTVGVMLLACSSSPAQQPAVAKAPPAGFVNNLLRSKSDTWEAFDIGGQFRTRFEHRSHLATPGNPGTADFRDLMAPDENSYWLFRTRVHMGFKPTDWASVYVEGRDSFSASDAREPDLETDRLDLHQGYVTLGNPSCFPITAKVGRQELLYGDERLIGAFEWNNIGRVFDAAKLRYEQPEFWVDAFGGRVVVPRDRHFNEANDYDWFWGVYGSSQALVSWQETQLYFLGRNTSEKSPDVISRALTPLPGARDIYTVGTRMKSLPGKLQGWDYSLEAAGQFGRFEAVPGSGKQDHRAFASHTAVGYTFDDCPAQPRLGVEYNFATGDDDPGDDTHETFENLFPTNHKFYGFMDLISWQNIHNVRFNIAAKPAKGLVITLDYHLFWLAKSTDAFYQANGAPRLSSPYGVRPDANNFIGSELDIVANYTVRPWLNVQGGYGHFFTASYIDSTFSGIPGGSRDADWVYAQFALNF